jgi:hypothetical protein
MKRIEKIINETNRDKYWILVHAKPFSGCQHLIKQKFIILPRKPSMMLSCLLFQVDNREGKLILEWALPGDWPVWSVGGSQEPLPETVASYDLLDKKLRYDLKAMLESPKESPSCKGRVDDGTQYVAV